MAYINMTKDFSEMPKIIPGIGLTKRQVIALIAGAGISLPMFFLLKPYLEITYRVTVMAAIALPIFLLVLHKKDGMYMEVHIRYFIETHFIRNTERPYQTQNMYALLMEEKRIEEEVEKIVLKGKCEEEIKEIKKTGQMQEITVRSGLRQKKICVPLTGKLDRATKKELERMVRKAKLKGEIPESAQETIPYKMPYPDGVFESADGYFTQTIGF